MAKYTLRLQARKLRSQGVSVNVISKQLGVAKSTASIWVRDIILTVAQLEKLQQREIKGAELGRLRGALIQKERRVKEALAYKEAGIKEVGSLTKRELLLIGIALYWAEGYKKGRNLQFCNSDPKMIEFLLHWLKECFQISTEEIRCRVGINEIHRERDEVVKEFWSKTLTIPLAQFANTSFKKVQNKKVYANFNEHYGTLSVEVRQPARFYGKIIGLIEGLANYSAG